MLGTDKRTTEIEIYEELIGSIQSYFRGEDVRYMFLQRGCYWLTMHCSNIYRIR